jgi:hypothetical protein
MIEDGTAWAGLANSVNRLKDSPSKSKVVILLRMDQQSGPDCTLTLPIWPNPMAFAFIQSELEPKEWATRYRRLLECVSRMPGHRRKTLTEIATLTVVNISELWIRRTCEVYSEIDQLEKY